MKTYSIRSKLFIVASITIFILMGIIWFVYQYTFSKYIQDEAYQNIDALVMQTNKTMESSFNMIENSIQYFFMDRTLAEWTMTETPTDTAEMFAKLKLDQFIQHSLKTNSAWDAELMEAVFLYVDKDAFSFYTKGNTPVYALTKRSKKISMEMKENLTDELQLFAPALGDEVFFIGKSYIHTSDSKKNISTIMAVYEESLRAEYEPLLAYKDSEAYIIDQNGTIYSSQNPEEIGSVLDNSGLYFQDGKHVKRIKIENRMYYISGKEVSQTGLWLVSKIPESSYVSALFKVIRQFVMILTVVLLFLLAVSFIGIYIISRYLSNIQNKFLAIKNGDYHVRLQESRTTELNELSSTFNNMAERIDYLINQVYEQKIEMQNAEIRFLQSQINPHFLFNTFASIGTRAKIAGQEEIYQMITAITVLLQASFQSDEKGTIPLSEELEYVKCYLYIQKERFGETLTYDIEVEEEILLDAQVPRLCLEPIVENAVIHGIGPLDGNGTVQIYISREEKDIVMTVYDNGIGFDRNRIHFMEYDEHKDSRKHFVGLKNTHKRLQLLYGENYGVSVEEEMMNGAQVSIKLPYLGGEKNV